MDHQNTPHTPPPRPTSYSHLLTKAARRSLRNPGHPHPPTPHILTTPPPGEIGREFVLRWDRATWGQGPHGVDRSSTARASTTSSGSVAGLGDCGTAFQDYPSCPTRQKGLVQRQLENTGTVAKSRQEQDWGGGSSGPVLPDTHPVRRHIAFSGPPSGVGMAKGYRRERVVHMPWRACRLNLRGGEAERGSCVKAFRLWSLVGASPTLFHALTLLPCFLGTPDLRHA